MQPESASPQLASPARVKRSLPELTHPAAPLVMVTAYDYPGARHAEAAGVDLILVGDSLGNVVLGYDSTAPVTLGDIIHHAKNLSAVEVERILAYQKEKGLRFGEAAVAQLANALGQADQAAGQRGVHAAFALHDQRRQRDQHDGAAALGAEAQQADGEVLRQRPQRLPDAADAHVLRRRPLQQLLGLHRGLEGSSGVLVGAHVASFRRAAIRAAR